MNKSFTLIEILVVIIIIGVLSAFILVGISSITSSANIAKSKAFLNSMDNALLLGRVSQWKLDEVSGTTANDYWLTNTGVLTNFTDTTVGWGDTHTSGWMSQSNCVSGTCLKFDGGNYIGCGTGSSLNFGTENFTLSAWTKTISTGVFTIIAKGSLNAAYNQGRYGIRISSGYLEFYICKNEAGSPCMGPIDNTIFLRDGNWHYITGVRNANIVKIYIDGIYKTQTDTTTIYDVNNDLATNIGAQYSTSTLTFGNYFNGSIDDVRTYNQAISTSEIQQNYYSGLNRLFSYNSIEKGEFVDKLSQLRDSVSVNP